MALTLSNIKARDVHASKQSFVVHSSNVGKRPAGKHLASIHVVPMHVTKANAIEVLLLKFPANHPHWPDMWHVPGYALEPSENPEDRQTIFERVFSSMIHGLAVTITPVKTEVVLHYTARGKEVGHVHYAEVLGVPHHGKFFDMRELPENIPEHHMAFIKRAANAYRILYS
ncbi:hypothetical protein EYC59_03345 [Candidatus Saccharibacteria bacterium]|nr:MAG: hypothetical protein EYC59_03345 [Candidatus Saccharibacteria bacterium]